MCCKIRLGALCSAVSDLRKVKSRQAAARYRTPSTAVYSMPGRKQIASDQAMELMPTKERQRLTGRLYAGSVNMLSACTSAMTVRSFSSEV